MGKMKNLLLMTLLVLSSFSISAKQILLGPNSNSQEEIQEALIDLCLLYTSPSPRDRQKSRMPSYA